MPEQEEQQQEPPAAPAAKSRMECRREDAGATRAQQPDGLPPHKGKRLRNPQRRPDDWFDDVGFA